MDARSILDNLLNTSQRATQSGAELSQQLSSKLASGGSHAALLKGAGAGAAAAGALALLMGNKGTRKFAKKALTLGSTAALGGLAFKVFSDWKTQQNTVGPDDTGAPLAALAPPEASRRSAVIVQAMISAAKVDGHIDELEQARISAQIKSMGLEQDVTSFLLAEMNKPVDPARIAALADTPEAAAEMYLASLIVVDEQDPQERLYLNQLAKAMNLDPMLAQRLENQLTAS